MSEIYPKSAFLRHRVFDTNYYYYAFAAPYSDADNLAAAVGRHYYSHSPPPNRNRYKTIVSVTYITDPVDVERFAKEHEQIVSSTSPAPFSLGGVFGFAEVMFYKGRLNHWHDLLHDVTVTKHLCGTQCRVDGRSVKLVYASTTPNYEFVFGNLMLQRMQLKKLCPLEEMLLMLDNQR